MESKTHPKNPGSGPYALNAYGELERWSIHSAHSNAKVVVGAEKGFPGLENIQKDFDRDHKRNFKFYETLEETIDAAVALANRWCTAIN